MNVDGIGSSRPLSQNLNNNLKRKDVWKKCGMPVNFSNFLGDERNINGSNF